MKCLNCGNECTDAFCPRCGQKTSTSRFQIAEILVSTFTSIIGGDNKWLTTCTALLTRPGHMAREYILGKRSSYYPPVSLLISLVAVYAIVTYAMTDTVSPFDILKSPLSQDSVETDSSQKFVEIYQSITNNKVYFALFSVALNLLPYRFVFRKSLILRPDGSMQPLNIAEHFFALMYQTCFNMLLAFSVLPFSLIQGSEQWTAKICFVLPTIYCVILYKQILSISWLKSLTLNILSLILGIFFSFSIIALSFGILYGYDYAK